ncbi:MAG: sodium:proton antiporter, partial [Lachnospiraceae bacterium]|nr:sodium:proton antiporter [Lachnospiraceae bacterium]
MDIIRNFPCISIMLCLFAGIISSGLRDRAAMWTSTILLTINTALSVCTLAYTLFIGEPFVYVMGKFPAPWGNEIRAGILEALLAFFFCVIMLLSLFGGRHKLLEEVEEDKTYLYYVLSDLLLSSL